MDMGLKQDFIDRWSKYFPSAELPLTYFWSDGLHGATLMPRSDRWSCVIGELARVRKGESLAYAGEALGCGGSQRFFGFTGTLRPKFEYFLSCGIPGEMEGERYIKTPEAVKRWLGEPPPLQPAGSRIIFKRWDRVDEADDPEGVVFIAPPDVLSGLYTLAVFSSGGHDAVICPFGSGCSAIVYHPLMEQRKENPRAVLGMFDPSARPCVPAGTLSFAVPMKKFAAMVRDMDDSFLATPTWDAVRKRMADSK